MDLKPFGQGAQKKKLRAFERLVLSLLQKGRLLEIVE